MFLTIFARTLANILESRNSNAPNTRMHMITMMITEFLIELVVFWATDIGIPENAIPQNCFSDSSA